MNTETNPSHGYTEGADVPNQPNPEQAAKEAWENYSLNRAISFQHSGIANVSFMRGIEAYQASIKKMVEAEIEDLTQEMKNWISRSNQEFASECNVRISTLKMVLEMITTAMPPEK